jgi:hypothetical protein
MFQPSNPQRGARDEQFIVKPASISTATASQDTTNVIEGAYRCTVLRNGTGDVTITYNKPFARKPVVTANALHASSKLFVVLVSSTASATRLAVFSDAGTATDPTELHVQSRGFDTDTHLG